VPTCTSHIGISFGLHAAVFPRNTSMAPPMTQAAEKSSATTAPIHHHMSIASPARACALHDG
jgi:hypothetical protein